MCLITAIISDRIAFGKRCDKNPLLKYFTAADFGLTAEPVSAGKFLKGFIYRNPQKEDNGKVIVFCHGLGAGHIAYTTEIAYFCSQGYTVAALDSKGCNLSGGKNIKGMYEGVKTATSAIDLVREKFGDIPVYLVGHSWGAYSALCASYDRKVNAVVAISAPVTPTETMYGGAVNTGMPKLLAYVLRPYWWIINLFRFGAKGNANAARRARKNATPTLLIHGDNDGIVKLKNSAYFQAGGGHITKLLCNGKKHNPYNTENAERLLGELSLKLSEGENIKSFDFSAATQEDKEVMTSISEFLENN